MYPGSSKSSRKSLKSLMSEIRQEEKKQVYIPKDIKVGELVDKLKPVAFVPAPDMKVSKAHESLLKHSAFVDLQSLVIDKAAWKHNYPLTYVAYDKLCFSHMAKFLEQVEETEVMKVTSWMKEVGQYISSNGSLTGLVARMISSIPLIEPTLKPNQSVLDYMGQHIIFVFSRPIPTNVDFDDEDIFDIVERSDAGLPFMMEDPLAKCSPKNLIKALSMAKSYITMLNADDVELTQTKNYFKKNPEEITFMLKRKHERMKLSNYYKKVRPYYVPPLALKLLFKWVSHFVEDSLISYADSKESNTAYGTSWFYGGTTKFVETVIQEFVMEAKENQTFVFKPVCFGDDNYWVFAFPDGSFFIMAPDVNAMDMNNPAVCGPVLIMVFTEYYKAQYSKEPPKIFLQIMRLLVALAYKTPTHLFGAYRMQIRWGKRAGIPLTTVLDIVCSGIIQGIVEQVAVNVLGSVKTGKEALERFKHFVQIVQQRVKEEVKCTFKEETLEFQYYENFDSITEFQLPFLGYKFVKITDVLKFSDGDRPVIGWVPVPKDLPLRLVSYCHPMRRLRGAGAIIENTMERIYGIVLSGGWYDTTMYSLLKSHYDVLYDSGARPSQLDGLPLGCSEAEDILEYHPELPTRQFILAMYMLDIKTFVDLVARPYTDGKKMIVSTLDIVEPTKNVLYTEIETLDLRSVQEASSMFASVAIAKRHAGKAELPKLKDTTAHEQSAVYVPKSIAISRASPKKKKFSKRSTKQIIQEQALESEFDDEEDESSEPAVSEYE